MTPVEVVGPLPEWSQAFERLARRIREAFGPLALDVEHIGSTSVPGLAAKDVLDVQVGVAELDRDAIREAVERLGLTSRPEPNADHVPPGRTADGWVKRFATGEHEARQVHLHVRITGAPNHRYALLFRDYLRADPAAREAYERAKRALATLTDDVATYADAKDPVCDLVMIAAERWAAGTGWP